MRHTENMTLIAQPIQNLARQGWIIRIIGENYLNTKLMIRKIIYMREPAVSGYFVKIR